jgi:hypothetical protein
VATKVHDEPAACEQAVIAQNKIEDYLLNIGHPIGGDKARFFLHFGFRREDWAILSSALRQHACENQVARSDSDADGVTYLVEGPLHTPSGRTPRVRSVWVIEMGELAPRFITAYPLPA